MLTLVGKVMCICKSRLSERIFRVKHDTKKSARCMQVLILSVLDLLLPGFEHSNASVAEVIRSNAENK